MAPSIAPPMTGAKMDRFIMIVLFELCYKKEDGSDWFLLYVIEKKKEIFFLLEVITFSALKK